MAAFDDPSRRRIQVGTSFYILPALAFFLVILFYPISLLFVFKVVKDYERAVLLRRGYVISRKLRGPGAFHILPCTDEARVVDIRTAMLELQQVEVTTKDGIGARLDVIIYHYISDPTINVLRVANTSNALSSLARDSLGTVVADLKQKDLFGQSPIGEQVQSQMAGTAEQLGVTVERVEIKEIILNSEAQLPEINEREITHRTLAKLQLSCKEDNFTHTQTIQQLTAILEETRTTLKLCHDQTKDTPGKAEEPTNSTDMVPNELLIKSNSPLSLAQKLHKALIIQQYFNTMKHLARAKVISAEGEQNASRVLREAADIMDESPATLQLRYLQTLHAISAQNNHTYVFPLPVDLPYQAVWG
ncbi:hypothetical protein EMCRGX_G020252 [Ephydatia muelleri]